MGRRVPAQRLWTTAEAAIEVGMSLRDVQRLIRDGQIDSPRKVSGIYVLDEENIEDLRELSDDPAASAPAVPFVVEERHGIPADSPLAQLPDAGCSCPSPRHRITETCPTRPRAAGRKDDAGKTRAGLMITDFPRALDAVANVTTFGAEKYAPRSWRTVENAVDRYTDALYRHLLAHERGEVNDPETGLLRLGHAAWNVLALIELHESRELFQIKPAKEPK